jgi:hypothetical protein
MVKYSLKALLKHLIWKFPFILNILAKKLELNCWCRVCGRSVHDFHAPDELWGLVALEIPFRPKEWGDSTEGGILCYDCFCELIRSKGHIGCFRLIEL